MGCNLCQETVDQQKNEGTYHTYSLLSNDSRIRIPKEMVLKRTRFKSNDQYEGTGIDILNMFADIFCLFIGDIDQILALMDNNFIKNPNHLSPLAKFKICSSLPNMCKTLNSFHHHIDYYKFYGTEHINYNLKMLQIDFIQDTVPMPHLIAYYHKQNYVTFLYGMFECYQAEEYAKNYDFKHIEVDQLVVNNINNFCQKYKFVDVNDVIFEETTSTEYEFRMFEYESLEQMRDDEELDQVIRQKFMRHFNVSNFVEKVDANIYFHGDLMQISKWYVCYSRHLIKSNYVSDMTLLLGLYGVNSCKNNPSLLSFNLSYYVEG